MKFDKPRDVPIFRPYDEEVPFALVGEVDETTDLDFIRIAKLGDTIVGAYRLTRLTQAEFRIDAVGVIPEARQQGLGAWLIGHAVGLAETKGGRSVVLGFRRSGQFYERLGFKSDAHGALRLDITPE